MAFETSQMRAINKHVSADEHNLVSPNDLFRVLNMFNSVTCLKDLIALAECWQAKSNCQLTINVDAVAHSKPKAVISLP